MLFPCCSVRSLPQETDLHKLLQLESFPRAAVLHKLLLRGSLLQGSILQEQAAPVWVPHGVASPASKAAPAWAPLSTGPQVLAGACSSEGFPQDHSLFRASTCSGVGSSTGCRWTTCLTMVFTTSCWGISALALGAPPPPPSSLNLVSAEFLCLSLAAKCP